MIQETGTDAVSLPSYRTYANSPEVTGGNGVRTFVRKELTVIEQELHKSNIDYSLIAVVTGKKKKTEQHLSA
ncbi:hypothetical protein HPB48_004125 [Haemaphysalis longicornis]|uniref:Uncharacterized protein n=1 Tax=Haemaphysalis longicornis TaxID=44386 RepID=A0A9J6FV54_HAELO|nr:hypothetical protein HPB48_004125 [Haemaphysalis longicornis]